MKKILSIILTVLLIISVCPLGLFSITASADANGTTGDCTWSLDGTVLTISGNGAMKDYDSNSHWMNATVTEVIIGNGVKNIGSHAFCGFRSLTSVTIGKGVTSIGDCAFYGCSNLTSVKIPDSVTSIGGVAFGDCTSLKSVTIGKGVTSIGDSVFNGCTGLISVTIPDSVTSIGDYAFSWCTSLTSVTIPDSVTSIGDYAFSWCTSLTSVTIPDSVTSIGLYAFNGCTGLTSVTIPDSVTNKGCGAFKGCTSLNSITLPFVGGSARTHLGYIFGASKYSENADYVPESLKTVIISDKCTYIDDYAFYNCENITSVTIGKNVTGIGYYAFKGCTGLTNITIANESTKIDNDAFDVCNGTVYYGKTVYWSGYYTEPTETDSAGNYIINTPEELAYVSRYGGSGKNYKVADGIKAFVLQPFDTTNITELIGYNNANDVKSYFDTYSDSVSKWLPNGGGTFTGTFDGNGVTIYGMYATGTQVGLFGTAGDGTVIKNISLKSCYASGNGGLLVCNSGNTNGTKKLTVKNCEIANSCIYQTAGYTEHRTTGVVAGNTDSIDFDGLLIYNIDAYTMDELQSGSKPSQNTLGIVGFKANDCGSLPYGSSISNSLIFGVAPYGSLADALSYALGRPEMFSNVYTDMPVPAVYTNNSFSYKDSQIKHIDVSYPSSIRDVSTCPNLDWSETWIYTTNSGALLRSLHNFELIVTEYTHCYKCVDCDAYTPSESHDWSKKDGKCTVCGCECGHTYTTYNNKQQLDCTHDEICDVYCTVCGKTVESNKIVTVAPGHKIVKVEEIVATDCSHDGVREHYKCENCEKLFEDANGVTEITDKSTLITTKAVHTLEYHAEVTPTLCTDNGVKAHYECTGCKKWFSDADGENEITDKTDYYFIGAHNMTWVDEVSATYYSEGVKGHYVCSICNGKFYDRNGTNPATDTDLVIERIPLTASGATGSCVWRLYGTTLVITGYGEMDNYYYYNSLPWGTDITEVIIENGVTSIGDRAFYNCTNLTSITIPNSVTSIYNSAFGACKNLKKVDVADISAFYKIGLGNYLGHEYNLYLNGKLVTDIVIPDGVTSISSGAFQYCTNLKSITIPDSVTSIGDNAFYGCTCLKKVNITDISAWCNIDFGQYGYYNAFYYGARLYLNNKLVTNLVIPDGVTKINENAFRWCDTIMKVTIPDTVTEIGEAAFYGCTGLEKVTLGNGLKTIGNYVFKGCGGITEIVIPEGVTSIGTEAFVNCTSLTSITIPKSVTRIGYYGDTSNDYSQYTAFYGCTSLTKVNITDISAWCNIDFQGYTYNMGDDLITIYYKTSNPLYYAHNLYLNGELVTDLVIPNTVTEIKNYAFYGCTSLKNVKIPSTVTDLSDTAFYGCYNIETIELPNIEIINSGAFSELTSLKKMYLPKSISIIYSSAFSGCDAVTDIYYEGTAEEWEDVVIQHSNGNLRNATVHYGCTGLPEEQEPEEPPTETPIENIFDGASVTLTNSISVNFKVKKDQIDSLGLLEIYVKFTFGGTDYIVKNYTENGDYYVFTFDNIAPDRIGDDIQATLFAQKDGKTVNSETVQYSVATYCYNMLTKCAGDEYSLFRTLLVDLLNYGAKAQIYTGHKTGSLATAKLTETQKTWGTQTDRQAVSVKNLKYGVIATPTVDWTGGGLYLKNSVMLRFTITAKSIENLTVKVVCADKTYYIQSDSFVARSDVENGYYVYVDQIGAAQMSEAVYLTVYNGEDAVSNTICYSVESYVAIMAGSTNTAFNDLLNAMLKYGDSAKAYVQGN